MTKRQAHNLKPGDRVVIFPGTDKQECGKVANISPFNITINWDNGERALINVSSLENVARERNAPPAWMD